MTISYIGGAPNTGDNTAPTITHGLTILEGDLVYIAINSNNAGSVDHGGGEGTAFVKQQGFQPTSESMYMAVFTKTAGPAEPASYTFSSADAQWQIHIRVYRSTLHKPLILDAAFNNVRVAVEKLSTSLICEAHDGQVISDNAVGIVSGSKDNRGAGVDVTTADQSHGNVIGGPDTQVLGTCDRIYTTGETASGDVTMTPSETTNDRTVSTHGSFVEDNTAGWKFVEKNTVTSGTNSFSVDSGLTTDGDKVLVLIGGEGTDPVTLPTAVTLASVSATLREEYRHGGGQWSQFWEVDLPSTGGTQTLTISADPSYVQYQIFRLDNAEFSDSSDGGYADRGTQKDPVSISDLTIPPDGFAIVSSCYDLNEAATWTNATQIEREQDGSNQRTLITAYNMAAGTPTITVDHVTYADDISFIGVAYGVPAPNNTAVLPAATLTLTGQAPQAVTTEAGGNTAELPAASISLAGQVPSAVSTEKHISQLPSATLTLTAQVPQTISTENRSALLAPSVLSISPNAPQAVTTENNRLTIPSQNLSMVALAPNVVTSELNYSQIPSASLALTPRVPSIVTTENTNPDTSQLPLASVSLTANAPQVITTEGADSDVSQIPSASLTLTPRVPDAVTTENTNPNTSQISSASISITAQTPQTVTTEGADADVSQIPSASLALTPRVPDAVTTENTNPDVSQIPSASLTITPNTPQAITTEGAEAQVSQIPTASLTITPRVPDATTTENANSDTSQIPSVSLSLSVGVPQVSTTEKRISQLPSASLSMSTGVPQIEYTEKNISELSSASLVMTPYGVTVETFDPNTSQLVSANIGVTGYSPQVSVVDGNIVALPSESVVLTSYTPIFETTEKNIVELPSASLILSTNAPNIIVPEGYIDVIIESAAAVSITITSKGTQTTIVLLG